MNNIQTGVTLDVYADLDYFYEIRVGEEYTLTYKETRSDQLDRKVYVGFGSLEEMEAVAKAMLRAVKTAREMKEDLR